MQVCITFKTGKHQAENGPDYNNSYVQGGCKDDVSPDGKIALLYPCGKTFIPYHPRSCSQLLHQLIQPPCCSDDASFINIYQRKRKLVVRYQDYSGRWMALTDTHALTRHQANIPKAGALGPAIHYVLQSCKSVNMCV